MTGQLRRVAARLRAGPVRAVAALGIVSVLALSTAACTDLLGGNEDLEILWPAHNATLYDEEVLRARLRNRDLYDYDIYWYVDDGRQWLMSDEWDDRTPHKADVVDTWLWDWRGRGPYTVGFIAEDHRGREIARRTVRVYVE